MTIDELSTRLERVERQNQQMRAAGTVAAVFLVAVAALGQAAPPSIRTRLVEIVDEKGVVRANFGMTPGNDESMHIRPALTLFNERGTQERACLGVTFTDVPLLTLANGPVSGALYIAGSGKQRGLTVWGKEASVHVGTEGDDRPTITIMDAQGKVQFSAPR